MGFDIHLLYLLNGLAGHALWFDAAVIFFASKFQYVIVLTLSLLVYFSSLSMRRKLRLMWTAFLSFVVARLMIVEAMRIFYHRPRPFVELPVNQLLSPDWFYSGTEWSFPSGHATFFFALATAVFLYDKKWGLWLYAAASIISISRVVAGVHYPSDIIAGALIGSAVAYVMFHFIERRTFLKDT